MVNRALVKSDFEAFVIEKAERAETAAARGDSRAPCSIVRELGVRKRAGFKKVTLKDGSVAQHAKLGQRWWPDHFASQLGGTAATVDSPSPPEEGLAASTNCQPPSYDEIADVVAVLPKLRRNGSRWRTERGFPIRPLVMVTQLKSLLQKVKMGGRIPSAWRGTRLVDVPKTKRAGGAQISKVKNQRRQTLFEDRDRRTVPQMVKCFRSSQGHTW